MLIESENGVRACCKVDQHKAGAVVALVDDGVAEEGGGDDVEGARRARRGRDVDRGNLYRSWISLRCSYMRDRRDCPTAAEL